MNNIQLMNILNPSYDLLEKLACFFFIELGFAYYIIKQFSTTSILHDKVELFGSFNDFIELYDIGMSDQLKNVDFSGHSFYVRHISYSVLLQYFYSNLFKKIRIMLCCDYLLSCYFMSTQLYLPKCSFSNRFF